MGRLRPSYLVHTTLEFTGPVDHALLVESVRTVLQHHPALRSRFRLHAKSRRVEYRTDGDPIKVGFIDAVADGWTDDELTRLVELLCHTPFDLANDAPGRAEVIRTGEDTTLLVLTVHHIVFDGWSRQVVMREIAEVYRAGLEGRTPVLSEPVHPARVATARPASDPEKAVARAARRLDGAPAGCLMPKRTTDWSSAGARVSARVGPDIARSLAAVVAKERCTVFMGYVAITAAALARSCGQRDFVFGFPWGGRDNPAVQDAVGMFVNILPLRITIEGDPNWRDLLRDVRRAVLDSFRDAAAPFDAVTAAVKPGRELGKSPLIPIVISVEESTPLPDLADGVTARDVPSAIAHIKYEMAFLAQLDASSGRIDFGVDYPADLFDRTDMDGLITELRRCTTELARNPEASVLERQSTDGFSLDDPDDRLELVRTAWREVLDVEDLADDVNFFDAGGNSLLVIVLVERLSELSGRRLDTADIFQTGTIEGQARLLVDDEPAVDIAPRDIRREQLLDLARRRGGPEE